MQTKIIGGGVVNPGVELAVDPTFLAARVALRPLDFAQLGQILGHYRVSFITGTTVSIGAAGILAYLRWTDASRFLVLMRAEVGISVPAAITAATVVDCGIFVARGSTAAGAGGGAIGLTNNNQKLRVNMGSSLVTDARVATTAALTRPTGATADTQAMGACAFPMLSAPTLGATANTAVAVGAGGSYANQVLYKVDAAGQHPIVLSLNEHTEIQEITAGPVTGGIKWYITMEWAEVVLF